MHWEDPEGSGGKGGGRGGSGWGIHVNPWLIHVNVWQKPLQYCKVISLQLIKINGKKIYLSFANTFINYFWNVQNNSIYLDSAIALITCSIHRYMNIHELNFSILK